MRSVPAPGLPEDLVSIPVQNPVSQGLEHSCASVVGGASADAHDESAAALLDSGPDHLTDPKVVAFIGSFSASGTRVIPAAPDISMIAVPLSGRMPYWQSTGLPMGPVTVTVSRVPPMPQARASTVPSPPSPKAGRYSGVFVYTPDPFFNGMAGSREERLPFRESMAMVIFIILSLRLVLFHNKVGK